MRGLPLHFYFFKILARGVYDRNFTKGDAIYPVASTKEMHLGLPPVQFILDPEQSISTVESQDTFHGRLLSGPMCKHRKLQTGAILIFRALSLMPSF